VLSTPDLDAPSFVDRLKRNAGRMNAEVGIRDLDEVQVWVSDTVSAFGQLQRRYLSEREEELWRLVTLFQEQQKLEGSANGQFHDALRGVHDRLGSVMRLDDLRQMRTRLESELRTASELLNQKAADDRARAEALKGRVQELEAALVRARDESKQDALTGVWSRAGFVEQLAPALARGEGYALALVAVESGPELAGPDQSSHANSVLQSVVQALGKVARPGDLLGRTGPAAFCLLAGGTVAERLAKRLASLTTVRALCFPHGGPAVTLQLSLSVGVIDLVPGESAESLLQRAESAAAAGRREGIRQPYVASAAGC
jgi:GGDEF domain-containing protein